MKYIFCIIFIFVLTSCSSVDFVYDEYKDVGNPLYEKTRVDTSGLNLTFLNSYVSIFFGERKEDKFNLTRVVDEKKTKRSVEKNQATSDLNYELRFIYKLTLVDKNCEVYKKEILSNFSIIPKSSGYNYGTDVSLEKKYELAVTENLNQFVYFLTYTNLNSCL